jgi:hypothetical protein
MLNTKVMRLTAPFLAMAGWLAMSLPSTGVSTSYLNDYRVCAARLLKAGITAEAVSQSCATVLRPSEVSGCVVEIKAKTEISATDALSPCKQSRRPEELAKCVVGISVYAKEAVNQEILNYCARSLLPVRFAQCVVGLRAEINVAPKQAMDNCIDGSDRAIGISTTALPQMQMRSIQFQPPFESAPTQANPGRN